MSKAAAAPASPEGAAPKKSKKMLFIIIGVVVLLLAGGGVAAFVLLKSKSATPADKAAHAKPVEKKPSVFTPLDPFTVNLADREREHYLQIGLTYEVAGADISEEVKAQMPLIRSRILLLLTSKTAVDLATPEGKNRLAGELIAVARQPMEESHSPNAKEPERGIVNVHFSAFIIQ